MTPGEPASQFEAVEVPFTYCWQRGVAFKRDGKTADHHYDPGNPCPGPHGIMWAAT